MAKYIYECGVCGGYFYLERFSEGFYCTNGHEDEEMPARVV